MATIVDLDLARDLEKFGLVGNNACFSCGTCTVTCSLSEGEVVFPRKGIRLAQIGLKEKFESSVEPWLCYYCGECSKTCPREAEPGEQMMAFRRYLTSAYDWTGLSRKFYVSKAWEIGAILLVGIFVLSLFGIYHWMNPGQIVWGLEGGYVHINSFAPAHLIHYGDWAMAAFLTFFLLTNVLNMWRKVMFSDPLLKVPWYLYIQKAYLLAWSFAFQPSFSKCENRKQFWGMHLLFVSGYVIMFSLVMIFLFSFQIDQGVNWTTPLGYYATAVLLFGIGFCIFGRFQKTESIHKYSHFSDWTFLAMLFLVVVSGILVHVFRVWLLWPGATFAMYAFHLAVAVAMLVIEVPFSKWAHLAYRPIAIYLSEVKKAAMALEPASAQNGKPSAGTIVVEVNA